MPSRRVIPTRAKSKAIRFLIRGCGHQQRNRDEFEGITLMVRCAFPRNEEHRGGPDRSSFIQSGSEKFTLFRDHQA
jgi:hypothetical protein